MAASGASFETALKKAPPQDEVRGCGAFHTNVMPADAGIQYSEAAA
jgi:hypothetical protein